MDLVAIDKPANPLVHRSGRLIATKPALRCSFCAIRSGKRFKPAHRLDRVMSAVPLFALSPQVAAAVGEQFASGSVSKRYLAVVRGHPAESGSIDHPFESSTRRYEFCENAAARRHSRRVNPFPLTGDHDTGRHRRYPHSRYALLELTPVTGRKHQIRRHLKHIAHPIIEHPLMQRPAHRYFAEHPLPASATGMLGTAPAALVTQEQLPLCASASVANSLPLLGALAGQLNKRAYFPAAKTLSFPVRLHRT